MSDLQEPEYKHADLVAGFLVLGSLIISGIVGTIAGLVAWGIALVEISFLGAIWVGACHVLGGRIFWFFFVKHRHEPVLKRSHGLFQEVDYFLVKPSFPK